VILRKLFRNQRPGVWKILEKEVVDEMIFRTDDPRNRVMLELMARAGMRVGEVLKLRPKNIEDRKLVISDPKSEAPRASARGICGKAKRNYAEATRLHLTLRASAFVITSAGQDAAVA
jgi:integrase